MKTINLDELTVVNNEDKNRFEADLGGALAIAKYIRTGDEITITHTEVPEAFRNQGIGGKLVQTALEDARTRGQTVRPECPFVRDYIERNPEFQDLVLKK